MNLFLNNAQTNEREIETNNPMKKKDDPEIIIPESELGIKKNNLKNQLIIQVNSDGLLNINEEKI